MKRGFVNLYVLAAVAVICLIALAIISRNWSCRQPRPPRPPRPARTETVTVDSVPSGNTILGHYGKRERRSVTVTLQWIDIPLPVADAARAKLEALAGKHVRVEHPKPEVGVEVEGKTTTGVVYGELGTPCNLSLVMDGLADLQPGAPKLWVKERDTAKKAKRGFWGIKK